MLIYGANNVTLAQQAEGPRVKSWGLMHEYNIRAQSQIIVRHCRDIARLFTENKRGNRCHNCYGHIVMGAVHHSQWRHIEHGRCPRYQLLLPLTAPEIQVSIPAHVARPGDKQDTNHTSPHTVWCHGGRICEDGWDATEQGCFLAPEIQRWVVTHLPVSLQSNNLWHHRNKTCKNGVWRVLSALWIAV